MYVSRKTYKKTISFLVSLIQNAAPLPTTAQAVT